MIRIINLSTSRNAFAASVFIAFFTLLLLPVTLPAQPEIIDKVIATVGGELVLLSELEEQYASMEAQTGVAPPNARCNLLDNILTAKLLLNQAKLDSIEVSDEEVEDQLNARIERILGFMNNDLKQFEDYYGQSIDEVKADNREDLKSQLLIQNMRGKIMEGITVTPAEVKRFFEQIPRDSLPYFNSEVEVGEIVYKPVVNPQEKQRAISKLEELRKRIVDDGEKFEDVAKKFSDDGSARAGGDLGWTRRGKFVPEFEAAAYKLDQNEISSVIETQFGFHIIQMLERRGNAIHVRHILIKPEITEADLEKAYAHLDSVRQLIVTDSISFSRAVKLFSDKETQSYNNDGRMVNPASNNTFFEIGDLDPDVYFAVDTMKTIGSISKPFEFASPIGEPYFRIVQLQSRTAPHRANLKQDYAKIQQAAIQSKQSETVAKWVKNAISSTYVAFDQRYDNCPELEAWKKRADKP
ncbi:MAG: peptidylprolyl isomerase [Saprospiraceae bacterium]|nr:peptidylprolyl isomerase [Saprospiraceae bacterium]